MSAAVHRRPQQEATPPRCLTRCSTMTRICLWRDAIQQVSLFVLHIIGGGGDLTPVSRIFVSSPGGKCNHPIRLHPPVGHKVKHSADIGPHCSTAFIFFPCRLLPMYKYVTSFLQNISCLCYYICTTLPYLYSVFITKK